MIRLCEKYDVKWVMAENHPLGRKKNIGVKEALKFDWEYLIEIGSDDLLKSLPVPESDVTALMDFALINTQTGECKRLQTDIPKYGAGRMIKRWVVESMDLWDDTRIRGLDNSSTMRMAKNGIMVRGLKTDKPLLVSLKSDVNLWGFKSMRGNPYPLSEALEGLSEVEVNTIKSLYAVA
jgi:hypothetical protein